MNNRFIAAAACLLACVGTAFAQEVEGEPNEKIIVEDVQIVPGGTATVKVNYESAVEHAGYNLSIVLPEELDFVMNEGATSVFTKGDVYTSHIFTGGESNLLWKEVEVTDEDGNVVTDEEGNVVTERVQSKKLKVVVFDMTITPMASSGTLFSFDIKANENFTESAEFVINEAVFNGGQYLDEVVVKVTKADPTAIKGVTVSDESVNVYDLNGVLVRKDIKAAEAVNGLQKGIYIVNGTKVVVR